jgi:C4-type Zn-finger protein
LNDDIEEMAVFKMRCPKCKAWFTIRTKSKESILRNTKGPHGETVRNGKVTYYCKKCLYEWSKDIYYNYG